MKRATFRLRGNIIGDNDKTLEVVGSRPDHKPYIWIGDEHSLYATLDNARSLRCLARAILRALGKEG